MSNTDEHSSKSQAGSLDDGNASAREPSETPRVLVRLMSLLDQAGVKYHHSHHEPVFTSAEAAAVRGVPLHSGAKALILKGDETFAMAVFPADRALDGTAFRKLLSSRRLRFATKEELLELTGLSPGAVPPFGSLFHLPTYCDETLSENAEINFNAGGHSDSLRLACADYIALERPTMGTFTKTSDA